MTPDFKAEERDRKVINLSEINGSLTAVGRIGYRPQRDTRFAMCDPAKRDPGKNETSHTEQRPDAARPVKTP